MQMLKTILVLMSIMAVSCNEKELLSDPPDTDRPEISSLSDLQGILDNMDIMTEFPSMGEIATPDYYVPDAYSFYTNTEKNIYLWQSNIFADKGPNADWQQSYKQVFFANTVIFALPGMQHEGTPAERDRVAGSAYFIRAHAFYQLAHLFCNQYDSTHASSDLGLPLRLDPDPEIPSNRSSLQQTYDQVILDLREACRLLPTAIDPNRKNRPSRAAAYGLMARLYLIAGDYVQATRYADSSLQIHPALINYNELMPMILPPFTPNNEEVLYQGRLQAATGVLLGEDCYIDTLLYNSYTANDLRKEIFFRMNYLDKPVPGYSYTGDGYRFGGIATDEIYLIRAEGYARSGNKERALNDLNTLLGNRIKTGAFTPLSADSPEGALVLILAERRKELVFRGLRWTDIRRLNGKNGNISLTRSYNGAMYTLPARDPRFTFPIPPDIIQLTGMAQNPR